MSCNGWKGLNAHWHIRLQMCATIWWYGLFCDSQSLKSRTVLKQHQQFDLCRRSVPGLSTSLVGTTTKLCSIRLIFFSKWSDASSICKSFLTGEIKALACWCFWNKISKYTELRPMAPCRYTVSKNVHIYFFKQSSKKRADFNLIIFGTEFWRNVT